MAPNNKTEQHPNLAIMVPSMMEILKANPPAIMALNGISVPKDTDGDEPPFKVLDLPRELRDMIWTASFSSTRLTFEGGWKPVKPAPNSLSILRVCKQIYEETKSLWLKHVLFNFGDIKALLNKLTPLPLEILTQIRHVRLCSCAPLKLYLGHYHPILYTLSGALMLLTGLCLDRLTILASGSTARVVYQSLQNMIEMGIGWKELHFITPDSKVLAFAASNTQVLRRKPQPAFWIQMLNERDTTDTGASVTIYRARLPLTNGDVLNPSTREIISQNVTAPKTLQNFDFEQDEDLAADIKELLVVAKRGRNIDVSIPTDPYLSHDLRKIFDAVSWADIRRISHRNSRAVMDDPDDPNSTYTFRQVDRYENAEEYMWSIANRW